MVLLADWWLLATVYCLPVWLAGFFVNRDLNFRRSWKLSGAALLPGALLMAAGILLYDFGVVDLVQLGFIFGAHFVLGWIYLFVSLLFVPGISAASPKNPFAKKNNFSAQWKIFQGGANPRYLEPEHAAMSPSFLDQTKH